MMPSLLLEKNLKAQITSALLSGNGMTAKQVYYALKKKGVDVTIRAVYKVLNELVAQQVITKFSTSYEINPKWIAQLEKDANTALKGLLEKNLLGHPISDLKAQCSCTKGHTSGFCVACQETVCQQCGFLELKHSACGVNCLNCRCGNHERACARCGKPACLRCAKEYWMHEHKLCKQQNQRVQVGILEVDHSCWFANISEKSDTPITLNNFSDRNDEKLQTHSGLLKIDAENKHKAIEGIAKQQLIRQARLVHKKDNTLYIRTRALSNKSVDDLTKRNNSILLNPIIATDGKEQNLILSPSTKEMKQVAKGLQEIGGTVRIISTESINPLNTEKVQNSQIREFLTRVPKSELMKNLQLLWLKKQ